jgi:hypothetical protein
MKPRRSDSRQSTRLPFGTTGTSCSANSPPTPRDRPRRRRVPHHLEAVQDQIEPELELALAAGAHGLRDVLLDVFSEVGELVDGQLSDELLHEVSM